MKIIDAHLHLFPNDDSYGAIKAEEVGHENSTDYLRTLYGSLNILQGVVMSNRSLHWEDHQYPRDLFHYCIGLDTKVMEGGLTRGKLDQIEANLKLPACCGVKLYPGYVKRWLTDPMYGPVYEMAQQYQKPVAIHTGLTAHPRGHLKYAHPLAIDELVSDFRKTRFVMCHMGYPFIQDAAVVMAKNPNLYGDLSGFLDGAVDVEAYLKEYDGVMGQMRQWIHYIGCWDRLLFGTDFPIVNYKSYLYFVSRMIPEKHWDAVFFENANYVYQLGF